MQKKRLGLQTKLAVNEPGDIYEQEADRIADQVLGGARASRHHLRVAAHPALYGATSRAHGSGSQVPLTRSLQALAAPLEPTLRHDMEQHFGYNFSHARRHVCASVEPLAKRRGRERVYGRPRFRRSSTCQHLPTTYTGRSLICA